MATKLDKPFLSLCLVLFLLHLAGKLVTDANVYNRYNFPQDFVFGSGTSAYQVEGEALEDGRKASIFDTFAHSSGRKGNGDIASGGYYKFKEDVRLMVETGLDAYRFSISWSRLIPDGRGPVNPKGVEFYNNLINELVTHGIEPHVTLMHLDVPMALQAKYRGFLNRTIIEDFTAYADVCFREFGNRVKHWTTINEPNIFMMGGYDNGNSPPGRCSTSHLGIKCAAGDSATEPTGFVPATNTRKDELAARRSYDFFIGWFMNPLVYGDYPEVIKLNAGNRIPPLTTNESVLVKGSFDFIGLNHYTIALVKDAELVAEPRDFVSDMCCAWSCMFLLL